MSASAETIARRRVARGPRRPQYLKTPELDKVMMMLTALVAEVCVVRDRLATHEALAASGVVATEQAVEAYLLTPQDEQARASSREAMLNRVYRVLLEELEEARIALKEGSADTDALAPEWAET